MRIAVAAQRIGPERLIAAACTLLAAAEAALAPALELEPEPAPAPAPAPEPEPEPEPELPAVAAAAAAPARDRPLRAVAWRRASNRASFAFAATLHRRSVRRCSASERSRTLGSSVLTKTQHKQTSLSRCVEGLYRT